MLTMSGGVLYKHLKNKYVYSDQGSNDQRKVKNIRKMSQFEYSYASYIHPFQHKENYFKIALSHLQLILNFARNIVY